MKKYEKNGVVVEEHNPNCYSVWEREGFVEVEDAEEDKPKRTKKVE